jgi:microcystin-dependent protein
LPIGTIIPYTSNGSNPQGFLECNGAAVSREMYPELFSIIGTTYGNGDGSTTFNLPDLRGRFIEGNLSAGTIKQAGLPNITGSQFLGWGDSSAPTLIMTGINSGSLYSSSDSNSLANIKYIQLASSIPTSSATNYNNTINIDASRSSSIYKDSVNTVQPPSLTLRYLIKAFDSAVVETGSVNFTQYAQDLANRLTRENTPAFNKLVKITSSCTWTAPVTGWYGFTLKGAGGGGGGGYSVYPGGGGGEGGTSFAYEHMNAGNTATITIGAGGTGGTYVSDVTDCYGTAGGNTTVVINGNTYTAGGGMAGGYYAFGNGGSGNIEGCPGGTSSTGLNGYNNVGGQGGGNNGGFGGFGYKYNDDIRGGSGNNGGNGHCFIRYFDPNL